MTLLAALDEGAWEDYRPALLARHAEQNIAAGLWPRASALSRASAELALLLPLGPATPGHWLFQILAAEGGPALGWLWLGVQLQAGRSEGFVYDLLVQAPYRRQGHGLRALQAMEALARDLGLASLGLHVYAQNADALALYRRLGYAVSSLNLHKQLAG